jgi:hypothetical protein
MKRRELLKMFGVAPAVILTPGLLMPIQVPKLRGGWSHVYPPTSAISGSDIVVTVSGPDRGYLIGGETITLTLSGDCWVCEDEFNNNRQAIIDGLRVMK